MNLSALRFQFRRVLSARSVFSILLCSSVLLGMITRQWLRRNTLENPPSYDALVYQNQSYDDLALIEQSGWTSYFKKYTSGGWHVPPMYMALGTLTYLIFGSDPANAYLVNIPFHFLFGWSSYLLFRFARAGPALSLVATLLVWLAPSTTTYALRYFMTDFAAAASYLFATAMLMHSRRLRMRRGAVWFGIAVAMSLLVKSSLLIYYLPQAMLVLYWLFRERSHRRECCWNAGLATVLVLGLAGWFYLFNLPQILQYYLGWAGSRSSVTRTAAGIASTSDSLLYYFRNVARFHFMGVGARPTWGAISIIALLGLIQQLRRNGRQSYRTRALALVLGGQYFVLTAYPSKVNVVDFSLIPFYFLVPVSWVFAGNTQRRRGWDHKLVAVVLTLLSILSADRALTLVLQPAPFEERQDWKVKAALSAILDHADRMGYGEVLVGSTAIHPYYTCENLRFYAISGTFPKWRGRFHIPAIGSAGSAEALYGYVKHSDYIVTIEGWQGPEQIPNNRHAPQVNQWLAEGKGGVSLLFEQTVPRGSKIRVFFRTEHFNHEELHADGWATAGFRLRITSSQPEINIHMLGRLLLPPGLPYPARLVLTDEQGRDVSNPVAIWDSSAFDGSFRVVMHPDWKGKVTLKLASDREFSPSEHGLSSDHRRLLVRVDRIRME